MDVKDINYSVRGSGPTLIIFNGVLQGHTGWERIVQGLESEYTVVTFDFPNQWGSPNATEMQHAEEYFVFARDFLSNIGIKTDEAFAFGQCWGGHIIRGMHNRLKVDFRGVVLGSMSTPASRKYSYIYNKTLLDTLERGNVTEFLAILALVSYSSHVFEQYPNLFDYLKMMFNNRYGENLEPAKSLIKSALSLTQMVDLGHEYRCPVHVISSKFDVNSPSDNQQRYAEQIGAASFRIMPCGHTFGIEKPHETVEALREILRMDVDVAREGRQHA